MALSSVADQLMSAVVYDVVLAIFDITGGLSTGVIVEPPEFLWGTVMSTLIFLLTLCADDQQKKALKKITANIDKNFNLP